MKQPLHLLLGGLALSLLMFTACTKDEDAKSTASTCANYATDQVTFDGDDTVFVEFKTDGTVELVDSASNATTWDVKLIGTQIYFNSGTSGVGTAKALMVYDPFSQVCSTEGLTLLSDDASPAIAKGNITATDGSNTYWCYYSTTSHEYTTFSDRTIVFQTAEGNYGKMQIQYSASSSGMTVIDRTYTFKFNLKASGGTSF